MVAGQLALSRKNGFQPAMKLRRKKPSAENPKTGVGFGCTPPVRLHLPPACYRVSFASSVTASEIGDDGRFRRLSCSWRSSSRVRKSDRSRLLSYRMSLPNLSRRGVGVERASEEDLVPVSLISSAAELPRALPHAQLCP